MNLLRHIALAKAALGIQTGRRAFGGPLQAVLSVTGRCNIRCAHCYFYSPHLERPNVPPVRRARMRDEPPPDRESIRGLQMRQWDEGAMRFVVDELVRVGTQTFLLTGGEPFLFPHLHSIMERVRTARRQFMIYTNGTLLDRSTAEELMRLGCGELRISVLAGTPEVYVGTHPGLTEDAFDGLKETITYIAGRKAARGKTKPTITLVFIVFSQNCGDILAFARFASSVGADQAVFRPIDDIEDPGLSRLVPSLEEAAMAREQLSNAAAYLESRRIRHNIPLFLSVFGQQLDTSALYRVIPCYYGWVWTRIDPDGFVYPCCRCYEPMGNAFERPFGEIWNADAYRRFRSRAIALNRKGLAPSNCDCGSCSHFTGNLRVHRMLHPFAGRHLKRLGLGSSGTALAGGEW